MCYMSPRSAEVLMRQRIEEGHRQAQLRELQRQVTIGQQGVFSRYGCCVLRKVGHRLVALGQRLERYGLSQPSF